MRFDVDRIGEQIADRMFDDTVAKLGDFDADLEYLFEKHFDQAFEIHQMPEHTYIKLYNEVWNTAAIQGAISEIRLQAREESENRAAYYESPMHYYGLRQSDFV